MKFEVFFTADAKEDIADIYGFIAGRSGAAAADRMDLAIGEACLGLSRLPARGNIPKELRTLGVADFRELHVGVYRVICQIVVDRVYVHCVLDGRRDMQSLLHRRLVR